MKTNFIKSIKNFFLKMKEDILESIKNFFLWISENPMTKTKRFLLLISANPVMTTIGVSVILFVVILAFLAAFDLFVLAAPLFYITVFYFGVVMALVIAIRKLFKTMITMVELKKDQVALIYSGEKARIYQGPFWGKPSSISIIQLPNGWIVGMKNGDQKSLEIMKDISLDKDRISFSVVVRIIVKFYFSGPFKVSDLECVSKKGSSVEAPSLLTEYVKEVLQNGASHFEAIQNNATDYYNGKITKSKLINEILLDIEFPKRLFSNIFRTRMVIKDVDFRFEREL